ncbi:MAG: Spy/CpxP family protein refolding chaperone [Betaproteobacteria bacterium]|nr:Spy/CpxP family protein refolding chaperone [Betaproteobacteria bacterium]
MNITRPSRLAAFGLAALLSGTAPALLAADPPSPPQYGPGMMNGYGGYGMGPGMMGGGYGGYGMGPGMMGGGYGGYGMGPGMMGGGYGMGPGMMGGYGMGPGMMGPYWGSGLDLTPDQQAKINKIQDETRKAHWAMMGEMMNQQAKLRDLNLAPKRDNAAIDAAYKEFGKLQQQMYDSAVAAHKRMEAVLTKEQQEKLRDYWRKGWAPNPEK